MQTTFDHSAQTKPLFKRPHTHQAKKDHITTKTNTTQSKRNLKCQFLRLLCLSERMESMRLLECPLIIAIRRDKEMKLKGTNWDLEERGNYLLMEAGLRGKGGSLCTLQVGQ